MLDMNSHWLMLVKFRMTRTFLRMQFFINCMKSNCIYFLYNLHEGYIQGTTVFISSSLDCLYRNCRWTWHWGLCTVKWWEWNKLSPQFTWMDNGEFSWYSQLISTKIQHLHLSWNRKWLPNSAIHDIKSLPWIPVWWFPWMKQSCLWGIYL
jgi:hypothetical protein